MTWVVRQLENQTLTSLLNVSDEEWLQQPKVENQQRPIGLKKKMELVGTFVKAAVVTAVVVIIGVVMRKLLVKKEEKVGETRTEVE